MDNKGYQYVKQDKAADILLSFDVVTDNQLDDIPLFKKTQLSAGLRPIGSHSKQQEKGSIYIAMYENVYDQPKWHVLAQGPAAEKESEQLRKDNALKVIATMLKPIPHQVKQILR